MLWDDVSTFVQSSKYVFMRYRGFTGTSGSGYDLRFLLVFKPPRSKFAFWASFRVWGLVRCFKLCIV